MKNYPSEIYDIENSREIELIYDDLMGQMPDVAVCDTCGKELTNEDIDKCEDYCITCWNKSEIAWSKRLKNYTPDII